MHPYTKSVEERENLVYTDKINSSASSTPLNQSLSFSLVALYFLSKGLVMVVRACLYCRSYPCKALGLIILWWLIQGEREGWTQCTRTQEPGQCYIAINRERERTKRSGPWKSIKQCNHKRRHVENATRTSTNHTLIFVTPDTHRQTDYHSTCFFLACLS